jgi:hypothetical protein
MLTNGAAYSNGFAIEPNLIGFAYRLTQPVLAFTNGFGAFTGMNLETPFTNGVRLTRTMPAQ